MEEVVALIFHGCKLVKDLEETLPNISNQPHFLISSCAEISRVFGNVREHLNLPPQDYGHHEPPHAMDMVLHEQLSLHQHHGMEAIASQELGGGQNAETDVAHSSLKQTRKRNHEVARRRFRVPAPRMGNTEVPPEDGYSWRKYGQKEILGSKFPRAYYRCTHQKLNNCPAKKQVQRLDNDPYTFEVTYRGDHACMMSSSAPSLPPPPPSEAMSTCSLPASQPLPHLLPMNIKESVGDLYNVTSHGNVSGAGSSPPNIYVDYPRVTDLVDTLFNSDINNNNSINFMFSSEDV